MTVVQVNKENKSNGLSQIFGGILFSKRSRE